MHQHTPSHSSKSHATIHRIFIAVCVCVFGGGVSSGAFSPIPVLLHFLPYLLLLVFCLSHAFFLHLDMVEKLLPSFLPSSHIAACIPCSPFLHSSSTIPAFPSPPPTFPITIKFYTTCSNFNLLSLPCTPHHYHPTHPSLPSLCQSFIYTFH